MESKRKNFFILLLVLLIFTVSAALFSDDKDMVYEPREEIEETEDVSSEHTAVSAAAAETDFFADFRMNRERRRDEQEEFYCGILEDSARDETAKSEAEDGLKQLYRISAMEDQVEEILVGRNYRDAVFVMGENISLLIMKDTDLSMVEKESLSAFVCSYAGIEVSNLSVFTVE